MVPGFVAIEASYAGTVRLSKSVVGGSVDESHLSG